MAIENVTKRNGVKEKFNINKILGWELWACNGIKQYIDWRDIILKVKEELYEGIPTQEIQELLIEECNNRKTWFHSLVAGRLYTAYITKKIFPDYYPNVKDMHAHLVRKGVMQAMSYTDAEYAEIDKIIDHSQDYDLAYLQVFHIVNKYGLSNRVEKILYETPQFIFMRMAMDLAEDEPDRLQHIRKWYKYFSKNKINAPTPNYINLGTPHKGLISCCLYTVGDSAESLAIGDHIAYTMTYMSAGIGGYKNVRSIGNPVKGGLIKHMGKLPYFAATGKAVTANIQASRGGANNDYFSCYDPEVIDIIYLQNPRTSAAKQNRDMHFTMQFNDFFIEKLFKGEKYFTFNAYTAPDLQAAFFEGDADKFKAIYEKYEADPTFKKNYVSAFEVAIPNAGKQAHEVATLYFVNVREMNHHTPYKDTVYQANLCVEVTQPTQPYYDMRDLYSTEDHGRGEISLCGLGGIIPSFIDDDAEYEDVAYYTLLMIDKCIQKNRYVFPHLEMTAKARMNAAVGLIGVAYDLAKHGFYSDSIEGYQHMHKMAERHFYFLLKASIRLGEERGNAKWMHKTKWPEGWLPLDTYNRNVDTIAQFTNQYDFEPLRAKLIANKGMRFSSLVAHMPTESSSKATGMPNGLYDIRDIYLKKTDGSNAIDFIARDSDILGDKYTIAWTVNVENQYKKYGIFQKWADESISGDVYSDRTVEKELKASRLLDEWMYMYKYGVKSRYYTNSKTTQGIKLDSNDSGRGCGSGACTL